MKKVFCKKLNSIKHEQRRMYKREKPSPHVTGVFYIHTP